jgi:thymidine kinase
MGFLEITFGPMYSGKSGTLLKKINNFITLNEIQKNDKKNILIINSSKDTREELKIVKDLSTHEKYKNYDFPDYVKSIKINKLNDISDDELKKYTYLAIDESQFFDDLKGFVIKCLKLNKYIHCTGLIADSEKNQFGQLSELFIYADEINHLKAFCVYCKTWNKTASFTKWVGDEEKINKIEIGATDKYIPVCGKHY